MKELIRDESKRVTTPHIKLQILADGEHDATEPLLNGEFDQMTLTDKWTGETVILDISNMDKKHLVLYDASDWDYEHYLINDRAVEINREVYDRHIERNSDTVRVLFDIGKYSVLDTKDNVSVNSYLVYGERAFEISMEFCYELVTEFHCETDRKHLLELLDDAVSV